MVWSTRALRLTCALLATGLLLSSCATMDANECKAADWRQIGRSDGERGHGTGRLDEHRKACAEHGITPNADRYWLGRSEGLQHYCRLDNALRVGRAGQSYQGVCPPAVDAHFRQWHAAAYEVSRIRSAMDSVNSEIDLHDYAAALDGLVLQGGNDVAPETYGEAPLHADWHGDRVRDRYEIDLIRAFVAAGPFGDD